MSGKIMGQVFDLELPANKMLVLLAMADHADHEGNNVYPSVDLLAWKTGYSVKQIRRIIKALVKDGLLKIVKQSKGRVPSLYSINIAAGKQKPPRPQHGQNDHVDYAQPTQDVPVELGQNGQVKNSEITQHGHFGGVNPDIAMSPQPSLEPLIPSNDVAASATPSDNGKSKPRKSDPVFTLIAKEAFGIEGKVTDKDVRGRINGLNKTARTTFEDQFGRMDEEKLCNAIREFYRDCDKQNMQRPSGRGTFGTRFRGFLEKRAKAAKNKVIALPVEPKEEKPTAEQIKMQNMIKAGISELAEKMKGA